jgi:hypothetical protein
LSTELDVNTWLLDLPPEHDLALEAPDWPAMSLEELTLLQPPDCPCCIEPPPHVKKPEWWAIPGVFDNVPPPPRPPASSRVAAVVSAVAGLSLSDPAALDELQAVVDLEALSDALRDLRIAMLPALQDAHARRLHVTAGHPTLGTWRARRMTDLPREDLTLGGRLRRLPVLDRAVQDQVVGLDAARRTASALLSLAPHVDKPDGLIDGQPGEEVIAAVVDNTVELVAGGRAGLPDDDPLLAELEAEAAAILSGGGSQLDKLEQALTLLARRLADDALRIALAQQRDALLPNELERRAQTQHDRRSLRQEQRLDDLPGDIVITPDHELHELFWTLLHATGTHDPTNADDTEAKAARPVDHDDPERHDPLLRDLQQDLHDALNDAEDDDRTAGVRQPRSKAQRLHDALKLILQQHLAAGLAGSTDKAPVAMTVTLPSTLLEGRPGSLPGRGRSGLSLPKSLLRQWWNDATVTAYVLTRGMIPLGLIHAGRTLTAAERVAARLQRGGLCDVVGCCRPGDPLVSLVPHHLYSYAKNGRTSLHETVMACSRTHQDIHHGKAVQLRDGRWINENGPCDPPQALGLL